jgi:hypothetical protein
LCTRIVVLLTLLVVELAHKDLDLISDVRGLLAIGLAAVARLVVDQVGAPHHQDGHELDFVLN